MRKRRRQVQTQTQQIKHHIEIGKSNLSDSEHLRNRGFAKGGQRHHLQKLLQLRMISTNWMSGPN